MQILRVLVLGVLLLALAACSTAGGAALGQAESGSEASSATPSPSPSLLPSPSTPASPASSSEAAPAAEEPARPDLGAVTVALAPILMVDTPTAIAVHPNVDLWYLSERSGRLRVVRGGALEPQPVLDLSAETTTNGERGLLGAAVSPDGTRLYLSYTDANGDSRLDEFTLDAGGVPDAATRRNLLQVAQPYSNHNGGNIAFGRDGLLYLGLGDGGGRGDPGENAQALDTLLGKILRINPVAQRDGAAYGIPPDNPFVGRPDARAEIWSYGLRNPWRFSFDRETGDLWIGDVGQNAVEEINFAPAAAGHGAGANYGWDHLEGNQPYEGNPPPDAVAPVHVYPHDGRCSVTGGYVYRGPAISALRGAYIYGDLCERRVRALALENGQVVAERDLGIEVQGSLIGFAEDAAGELYVLSQDGGVFKLAPG